AAKSMAASVRPSVVELLHASMSVLSASLAGADCTLAIKLPPFEASRLLTRAASTATRSEETIETSAEIAFSSSCISSVLEEGCRRVLYRGYDHRSIEVSVAGLA